MEIDLSKYENIDTAKCQLKVSGEDSFIVGEEVDENNHLWYVIKTEDGLIVSDAEKVSVDILYTPNISQIII